MTSPLPSWSLPPERLSCGLDEVHVWRLNLDLQEQEVEHLEGVLSTKEIGRANKFLAPAQRRRYIVCHAGLRLILGRYVGVSPEGLSFRSDRLGKPRLEDEVSPLPFCFSMSHSEEVALYSVSCGFQSGVDVECLRPHLASPWIADRFFLAEDAAWLKQFKGDSYVEKFFVCWTRTEAYLKACGRGLGGLGINERRDRSEWTVYDLVPGPGYVGALSVEGLRHGLVCYDLRLKDRQ